MLGAAGDQRDVVVVVQRTVADGLVLE